LIERLSEGLHRKLTLVSAPAGFGKTHWSANGSPVTNDPPFGCRWTKGITLPHAF
jgi:hypothetical protein